MSFRRCLLAGSALLFATSANALTLDFEEFVHGSIVTSSQGVVITTENFDNTAGHPDLGVAFDSVNGAPTTDPDLLQGAGWTSGNLAPNTVLDNLLIVQENDNCTLVLCSDPDDQAGLGGQFIFDFSAVDEFETFAFDLVDHEGAGGGETGSIEFYLNGGQVGGTISFNDFLGLVQGVVFGDNSANHIDLGTVGLFDEVRIAIRGSGAIDNIDVTNDIIPEPNTMALCGIGLVMLAAAGRKRDL